tara:strand:+ start:84 stop:1976 length:1893 start_codon:yes stop_codon:yes gene_type:complete
MTIKELNALGQEIFQNKYAYPGDKTYADRVKTVAKHIASAESPDNVESTEKKFFEAMSSGDFVPGGRILFGSGRNSGRQNLLNCYVIIPEDNVESIGQTIKDMYKISCGGGGLGFNFSKIRPKGDGLGNLKYLAPGSISNMQMIDGIGERVKAGGPRRVALMSILDVTHPDILEFLYLKLDKKELNNFNVSVAITDRFIEACENDEEWHFTFNNRKYYVYELDRVGPEKTSKINVVGLDEEDVVGRAKEHYLDHYQDEFKNVKKVSLKAKDVWNKIWVNAVESGDPGIYNVSLANKFTNVSYFEDMQSTNPCGEISLPSYGNCCLGHVNLANMVVDGQVDWKRLARTVKTGIRFLDNVLTVNHFPTDKCKEVAHRSRRIGFGVLGLHYMLIKLGYKYGDEDCLEFLERLFATIRNEAYKASAYIARDKGSFAQFNYKDYLNEEFAKTLPAKIRMLIKEHGIRNAVMLTIAPTGTTSMVHGVSSGLEPIFSAMYKRRYRQGNTWKETVVLDPLFEDHVRAGKPLEHFLGAYDVAPEEHMAVQATIQKYIDSCISKTINLPNDSKAEDLSDMALKYASELKGMTIYRAGSKGQEPLEAIPLTSDNIETYIGSDYNVSVGSADSCSIYGGDCG